MNESKQIRNWGVPAWIGKLLLAMMASLLPAFAQQEVAPTWYDPWPKLDTATVHSSQPRAVVYRHRRTGRAATRSRTSGKARVKRQPAGPRPS